MKPKAKGQADFGWSKSGPLRSSNVWRGDLKFVQGTIYPDGPAVKATPTALDSCRDHGPDISPDFLGLLKREIGRLPPEDREILFLCAAEQMNYEEVATTLSIPVDAIAKRIVRVRERLRAKLFSRPTKTTAV